jgi:hypothetical protein
MAFKHTAFGDESYEHFSVIEDDVRALRDAVKDSTQLLNT